MGFRFVLRPVRLRPGRRTRLLATLHRPKSCHKEGEDGALCGLRNTNWPRHDPVVAPGLIPQLLT
jgi:hypothetical protein